MQYKCKYNRGVHQDGDFGKEGTDDEVETACNGSTKKKYSLSSIIFYIDISNLDESTRTVFLNNGRREREFLYYKKECYYRYN